MKDWPYKFHPTGWYQIGWSWSVAPGEVKPMHIFDEDVVVYRTEGGTVNVSDGYCPHLGGNLGQGGCVKGETIQCPFHGWRFDLEGRNVEIPFTDSINKSVRLKRWHARELDHLIIVWYDGLGRDPWWEWPGIPEFRDPDYHQPHEYEGAAVCYGNLTVIPQLPVENQADPLHFAFVHGAAQPAIQELFEPNGHEMRIRFKILFGEGKESTWATPDGPAYGTIDGQQWGLGLGVARFEIAGLRAAQVGATTPVDKDHSLAFATMASLREPGATELSGRARRIIDEQVKQVRRDFHIWEHQRYVHYPSFVMPQERNYAALRRWTRQFYPDANPDGTDAPAQPSVVNA
jgi:phenylpropionate dioxygenase-like ring-hydroxylating dioxygenase large terminal subunit